RGLCRARGFARQICAAAGVRRGHVQSLALRPHRDRHAGGSRGAMSKSGRAPDASGRRRRKLAAAVVCGAITLLTTVAVAWVVSHGPVPLESVKDVSTTIVDRNGKLLRAFAMDDGRWRLPVKAGDVDPTYVNVLLAF